MNLTVCSSRLFKLEKTTLATKQKKTSPKTSDTKVTRIKARDSKESPKKAQETKSLNTTEAKTANEPKRQKNPFKAMGGYFKGAWYELKQVHWPTRRATWGMTAALIGFTAFFVAFILLLDALFQYSFDLMIG